MMPSGLATVGALALLVSAAVAPADEPPAGGTAITPEFAQALWARVGPLHAPDGCRVTRFDTSHSRITIGVAPPKGAEQLIDLATPQEHIPEGRTAGGWVIAVPALLSRDCPTTVAAIEGIVRETAPPRAAWGWLAGWPWGSAPAPYVLLVATFLVLIVGTVHVLGREAMAHRPPAGAVAALLLLSAAALGLRLWLSPRTFLHEYYHIAETVPAYLDGEMAPGYGKTGPALFRLVGGLLGRGDDLRIIFLTNAVIASLAVPAAALLVRVVAGSWAEALCAALLLAVLPQHLRFSASEDLFVPAITFGFWSLALFASYHRTRRLEDAVLGALAASLAIQSRPEMIFFPAVAVAFLVCVEPRAWRVLVAWRTLVAGLALAVLLVPHALDVAHAMREARTPAAHIRSAWRYLQTLVLFNPDVTPIGYPLMLLAGAVWAALRRPAWLLWIVAVYVGFTVFSLTIFDNPPYHLRVQTLPTSFAILLGAGAVPLWMAAWRRHRRVGALLGIALLVLAAAGVVTRWRGFVGELKDQQLEFAFLERHVPELPAQGTLLAAVEPGGHNLDAFPEFLLTRSGRRYALIDLHRAMEGAVAWPAPTNELLFYQGMFCYFAFEDHEPTPDPMTAACRAVHERYVTEPLVVEDLHTEGYSLLRYAQGGRGVYRIGFYRLTPRP